MQRTQKLAGNHCRNNGYQKRKRSTSHELPVQNARDTARLSDWSNLHRVCIKIKTNYSVIVCAIVAEFHQAGVALRIAEVKKWLPANLQSLQTFESDEIGFEISFALHKQESSLRLQVSILNCILNGSFSPRVCGCLLGLFIVDY